MKGPKTKDDTDDVGLSHSSQELDPLQPSSSSLRKQQNSKNCITCWLGLVVFTALLLSIRGSESPSNDFLSASTSTKSPGHSTAAGSKAQPQQPQQQQPGLHMEEDTNTNMKYAIKVVAEHPENNTEIMATLLRRASNNTGADDDDAAEAKVTLGTVYSEGLFVEEPNATASLYWFQ